MSIDHRVIYENRELTAQVLQMALKKYLEAQKHSPRLHHGRDYEIEVEFNVSFDEF